jgi:Ribbon-helix-helix protein, copG family
VPAPILATKLYVPPSRRSLVLRPRLVERLDEGLAAGHRLTLVSAPAGFGKTTLVSDWVAGCGRPAAWLSLDEGDSEPSRFLTYLIAALLSALPGDRLHQRWYHTPMDKTTIYLPVELKSAIRRVARRRGISEAEVIRDSIRNAVGGERPRPRGALFASGAPIARQADDHLTGFGER